jgi:hypothetical protein
MGIRWIRKHGCGRLSVALAVLAGFALVTTAGAANGGRVGVGRPGTQSHIDRSGGDRMFGPPGGEGATARLAAGAPSPAVFLNGMIDVAQGAANLSGPHGFVLGASLFLLKQLISSAAENGTGETDAAGALAKLDEINGQLRDLKEQLGTAVFDLQVGNTDGWVTHIRETEADLRSALVHAKKADDKRLSTQERDQERTAFDSATAEFIDHAHKLVTDNVGANLNQALIDEQVIPPGTQGNPDPKNPLARPALLTALRRRITEERFLTARRSREIREFFEYYEWQQVRLATVLTEYYSLGGPCATATPPRSCADPPKPDPGRAKDHIDKIKAYVARQRELAGMPAKYLDQEPLRGQVFIDTKSSVMWGIEPAFRTQAQITRYGIFSDCGVTYNNGPDCHLDAGKVFAGYSNWGVPSLGNAESLLAGRGSADPIAWLKTVSVTFNNPGGLRFHGYVTSRPVWLWLSDGWTVGRPSRSSVFDDYTRSIENRMLELGNLDGNTHGTPLVRARVVAHLCPVHQSLSPYYPIYARPDCRSPEDDGGSFIVWVRGITAADRKDYYVTPPSS